MSVEDPRLRMRSKPLITPEEMKGRWLILGRSPYWASYQMVRSSKPPYNYVKGLVGLSYDEEGISDLEPRIVESPESEQLKAWEGKLPWEPKEDYLERIKKVE